MMKRIILNINKNIEYIYNNNNNLSTMCVLVINQIYNSIF